MPARTPAPVDGFAETASRRIGGPLGRHAGPMLGWWSPPRIILAVGTLVFLAGALFRMPCRNGADHFRYLCYSDVGLLYLGRGLVEGKTPYLDSGNYQVLEYPVLTGWLLELERIVTAALGGAQGVGLSDDARNASMDIFMDVNYVIMGLCLLVALWAQLRTVEGRPWDAMLLAASPCVLLTALINWDLLVVALTALAMMFWARRKPALAGVMLGLGMAAKLYPALLLGPLLLLCLRGRRMPDFATTFSTFAISWGLVNLPALILAPDAWRSFWTFNSDRGGDLGSVWYVLSLSGYPVPHLNAVSAGVFALMCLLIGALILFAPRRPRFGAMAFLVVAAFLLTNKVYSPQYVLWLLPLLILARPRWRDWFIFTAGEIFYFVAIWWHLAGVLKPGDDGADRIYWLAVITRLATQTYVVVLVVRDALLPQHDPLRVDGADDLTGGVLNDAPSHAPSSRVVLTH